MKKHFLFRLSILLCAVLVLGGVLCNIGETWSYYDPEGPAGQGLSAEEMIKRTQAAKNAGTPYTDRNGVPIYANPETGEYSYSYFDGAAGVTGYDYSNMGSNNSAASGSGSNATSQAGSTNKGASSTVTYEHDFDSITDEAQEALMFFTRDGVPESAYINIPMTSSENSVKGSTLNASTTGKEDLYVNFIEDTADVSSNKISWHFSNVEVEDDYSLDLTTEFSKDEASEYADTYLLSFSDGKTVSADTIKISIRNSDFTDGDLYRLYTEDNGLYTELSLSTVSNNTIEFPVTDLVSYTVSKTDIIAENEAKAAEEAKATEEAKAAEEAKATEKETATEEETAEASSNETNTEPVEASTETPAETPKQENKLPVLPIAVGCAVILLVIIVIIAKKKKDINS